MKRKTKYLKYTVPIVCVLLGFFCILHNNDFSVQAILEFTPQKPLRAAMVLLLLYALKSATVFFPLVVLEIAGGHLFSTWAALGINFLGVLIVLTIPYCIGRVAGMDAIQKLTCKYPRFAKIIDLQRNNSLFLCFFLRIVGCLPGDVLSMYFGATQTPFMQNLLAGALGILPDMILATLVGVSIQDPSSPMFWLSVLLAAALSLLSALLYHIYRRKLQSQSNGNKQKQ